MGEFLIKARQEGESCNCALGSVQDAPCNWTQTGDQNYRYILRSSISWWRGTSWYRGTVVERRSLTGELSLSCVRPAADG